MRSTRDLATGLVLLLLASAPAAADKGHGAELLDELSLQHHEVTTPSAEAQKFFDQGLTLAYGFNHGEAADAFRRAVELDPACAMCYWGIAYVLGPNINAVFDPANHREIVEALDRAQELAPKVTARERAYIEAMAQRYGEDAEADRAALDKAYADAMRRVAHRFPADLDAATLFAEALMDTTPWDYWTDKGKPKAVTNEFISVLETVLRRDPDHLGATHFLIHAVEKVRPELGVEAAENLEKAARGAGHLVHMASHIYIRVGRYHDASRVNQEAMQADDAYHQEHGAPDDYAASYMLHNPHFLVASASLEGRSELAISTARAMAARVDQQAMRDPAYGTGQHFWVTPLYALVRFGRWQEILQEPKPADDLGYPRGVWHFARGLALLRTGQPDAAEEQLRQLEARAADRSLDAVTIWDLNTTRTLLEIASHVLAGELAAARGAYDEAVRHLEKGIAIEDGLTYDEPPPWMQSVRHNLGAVLLEADRPTEAERVYREDLKQFPRNGWALFGLAESLAARGKTREAADVRRQLERAWSHADVELLASRL